MKRIILPFVVLLLAVLAPASGKPAKWSPEKIEEHRQQAASVLKPRAEKWLEAKTKLVRKCRSCNGAGFKVRRKGRKLVKQPCGVCGKRGQVPELDNWKIVFWDNYSTAYRNPENQRRLDEKAVEVKRNLGIAVKLQITKGEVKKVTVHGNLATVTVVEWRGKLDATYDQVWLHHEDGWFIEDPEADAEFERWEYPPPPTRAELEDGLLKAMAFLEQLAGKDEVEALLEELTGEDEPEVTEEDLADLRELVKRIRL
jgi:hypothetical protein